MTSIMLRLPGAFPFPLLLPGPGAAPLASPPSPPNAPDNLGLFRGPLPFAAAKLPAATVRPLPLPPAPGTKVVPPRGFRPIRRDWPSSRRSSVGPAAVSAVWPRPSSRALAAWICFSIALAWWQTTKEAASQCLVGKDGGGRSSW